MDFRCTVHSLPHIHRMDKSSNEAILAAMELADEAYEKHWQTGHERRRQEHKALLKRQREQSGADKSQPPDVRQRNEEYRKEELEDQSRQHTMEEMYEEETACRRAFHHQDLEQERFRASALRLQLTCDSLEGDGFIPRGILFDLRSQQPKRLLAKLATYSDQPAVVGQACLELALLVCNRRDLCESVSRLGGCQLVMGGMRRFPHAFFVQEQGVNALFRLCSVSSCAHDLLQQGAFEVLMETFERMGVRAEGRPVRLMILRALESMCNKAARHVDMRRPPEQERRAMAAVTSALLLEPLRARFHEAGVRLLSTLCALRGDNFTHLFHVDTSMLAAAGSRRTSKNDAADSSDRRISASGHRLSRVGLDTANGKEEAPFKGRRSVSGPREEDNKGEKGEKPPRPSVTVGRASVGLAPLALPPPTIHITTAPAPLPSNTEAKGSVEESGAHGEGPSAPPDLPRMSVSVASSEALQAQLISGQVEAMKVEQTRVEPTFPEVLRGLLASYGTFDVRVVRGEGAAVVREAMRLVAVLCVSCDDATVVEVLTRQCPWVLEQLYSALKCHSADPLVQLAWVQLWEILLDRHMSVARWFLMNSGVGPSKREKPPTTAEGGGEPETEPATQSGAAFEVVAHFLRAMHTHRRIHALVWRHLANLTLLYKAGQGGLPPRSAVVSQVLLDNGGMDVLQEVAIECAGNGQVMYQLLGLLSVFSTDFRFLVSLNRDEVTIRDELRSALALHARDAELVSLGKQVMTKFQT